MQRLALAVIAALTACTLAGAAQADVYVAPKQGQSQQQFQQDQFDCHNWATQQTGFNPSQPVVVNAPPPQQGGMVRGAAGGAALGAVGGAIGGNAGKGAAIGAGVGALFGGFRRMRWAEEEQQQQQSYQMQQQSSLAHGHANYNRAFGACMAGRGYTVS